MSRNYSSIAEPKALASDVSSSATQITLNNVTGLPSAPYVLVLNPDTSSEEVILVNADQSGVTSPTLKVTRAIETGATAKTHTTGNTVKHMIVGSDLQLSHDHIDATAVHGATGAVVGTTNTQTLTNKTLTSPKVNENVAVTATATELNVLDGITASTAELNILDGATLSTTELNYVDGVTSAIQTQIDSLFPKGMITPFAGSSAPSGGWLLCDGAAVSRTTYAALYAVVADTYGAGDGSTTFNVPDLLGRVPMGAGTGTGLTARTLGTELGVESVTLTAAQSGLPAHGHSASASTSTSGGSHTHTIATGAPEETSALTGTTMSLWRRGSSTTETTNADGGHTHTSSTSVTVDNATATNAAESHTNIQPSTVVNYIIKY